MHYDKTSARVTNVCKQSLEHILSRFSGILLNVTLLKIIKGTHVMSGIADLASMLHFMQDMCLLGNCLSNIKSHVWMIFRVKTIPLGVDEHPHPYIRIGW